MSFSNIIKQEPLLIDSKQASQMLAICPRKLSQMTKDRQIPFLKMGKSVRFNVADLKAWIQQKTQPARDDHSSIGSI